MEKHSSTSEEWLEISTAKKGSDNPGDEAGRPAFSAWPLEEWLKSLGAIRESRNACPTARHANANSLLYVHAPLASYRDLAGDATSPWQGGLPPLDITLRTALKSTLPGERAELDNPTHLREHSLPQHARARGVIPNRVDRLEPTHADQSRRDVLRSWALCRGTLSNYIPAALEQRVEGGVPSTWLRLSSGSPRITKLRTRNTPRTTPETYYPTRSCPGSPFVVDKH